MGTHRAPQTAVIFHKARESVTMKKGRRVGTFLMLTPFLKWDTQEAPREMVNDRHLSASPQGKSTHLPTQRWAHILSPAHPARRSASGSMNAWFSHVCCLCYISPVLAFHLHECEIPRKALGPLPGSQRRSAVIFCLPSTHFRCAVCPGGCRRLFFLPPALTGLLQVQGR